MIIIRSGNEIHLHMIVRTLTRTIEETKDIMTLLDEGSDQYMERQIFVAEAQATIAALQLAEKV